MFWEICKNKSAKCSCKFLKLIGADFQAQTDDLAGVAQTQDPAVTDTQVPVIEIPVTRTVTGVPVTITENSAREPIVVQNPAIFQHLTTMNRKTKFPTLFGDRESWEGAKSPLYQ